jgi:thiol-disulfide isomerase/thioredoxin
MEIGQSAYDFQLPGVDGKTYSLKDFADKPVLVLFFWCNHCPYVKAYEDRVIQLANEFKDRAAFVAINSNDPTQYPEDSFENMQRIAQEKAYPFPYLVRRDAIGRACLQSLAHARILRVRRGARPEVSRAARRQLGASRPSTPRVCAGCHPQLAGERHPACLPCAAYRLHD